MPFAHRKTFCSIQVCINIKTHQGGGTKKDFDSLQLKDPLVSLFSIAKCETPQTFTAVLVTEASVNAIICKY